MRCLLTSLSVFSLLYIACSTNTQPLTDADAGTELAAGGKGGGGGSGSPRLGSTAASTQGGNPHAGSGGATIPATGGVTFTGGQQAPATTSHGGTLIGPPPGTGGNLSPATTSLVAGRATGGMTVVGGRTTGGTTAHGGSLMQGGAIVLGGRVASGGTSVMMGGSTGGASPSSSSSLPPDGNVYFNSGVAEGFMNGYAWVDMGEGSIMTSPRCEGSPTRISAETPCVTSILWSKPDALCMTGSFPALPASPTQVDCDSNWGMRICVNVTDPVDIIGSKIESFRTITFTFSGIPRTGVRAFVHRRDDPTETFYCYDGVVSGRAVTLTKFNTKCWGDVATAAYLQAEDLSQIDRVGLTIPSTTYAITVSDFCMERISFQ